MLRRKRRDPSRQEEAKLRYRELIQQLREDSEDLLHRHRQAVDTDRMDAVLLRKLLTERLRGLPVRLLRVHQHEERLPCCLHVSDGPLLRLHIILTRNVRDRSVGRQDDPDAAVLLHDLLCAKLCCLRHGDWLLEPRRRHHARRAVLLRAHRAIHHVPDRVNEPHRKPALAVRTDLHGLLRHKFRLRGHDGLSRAALRQLILRTLAPVDIFNIRQHQLLHKPLDKRGFSRPHRTHHADINAAVRALRDLLINRAFLHDTASLPVLF